MQTLLRSVFLSLPKTFFNGTLRVGQVGLVSEVPLRISALHFVTGYGFYRQKKEARFPRAPTMF